MEINLRKGICGFLLSLSVPLAVLSFMAVGCSSKDDVAGGVTEDAGIVADIAGVFQKGPFVAGSPVKVTGIDCKTLEPTGETVEGMVVNDKGEFNIKNLTLSTSCAIFEVSGYYLNEVTGVLTSDEFTLRAVTKLTDRNSVNVNLFTHMEYERVMHLVIMRDMPFADAKEKAEKEVLSTFGIEGEFGDFEDMNIFEPGDGNAALLAVSVMMQADADVAELEERLDKFDDAFAATGTWNDDVKAELAEWASAAQYNGDLEEIRANIEGWNLAEELPAFETFVEKFEESYENSAGELSEFDIDWSRSREAYLNPDIAYDSIVDERDGQVYKTVKIGDQVWMAQNLNYADSVSTPSLLGRAQCYEDKPEHCEVAGRSYTFAAAIDSVRLANDVDNPRNCGFEKTCSLTGEQGICPSGWHLPDTTEWNVLLAFVGESTRLMSNVGWYWEEASDDFGFSAFPAGDIYRGDASTYSDTRSASFFALSEDTDDERLSYVMELFGSTPHIARSFKDNGYAIRCVKD